MKTALGVTLRTGSGEDWLQCHNPECHPFPIKPVEIRFPVHDERGGLRAAGHDLCGDPARDAEPGEDFCRQEDAARARRHGDELRVQERLLEAFDRADVRFRGTCAHGDADGGRREVRVRAGGDSASRNEMTSA